VIAAPALRTHVHHRSLAIGLVMAVTLVATEAMAVAAALPALSDDLGGDRLYGAAFSVFMVASLVTLVLSGELADRRGPLAPFILGLASFGLGLVVVGLAPTMPVAVAGRVLQGAGAGALTNAAYVAIGRAWPPDQKAKVFAALSAAWIVPSLIGPAGAGLVTEAFGWRWVFLGILPLLPVVFLLAAPSLALLGPPEQVPRTSRARDAAALGLGATTAVAGLQSSDPRIFVLVTGAGVLVAARPLLRLLPVGTFSARPGLPAGVAARLAVTVAFFGTDAFVPLAASRLHDASPLQAGLVIVGASLSWSLGSAVTAKRLKETTPGRLIRLGFVVLAAGISATIIVAWSASPLWVTFLTWSIAGFGIGTVFTTVSTTGMNLAAPGTEGLVGSQLGIADALGFAIATAVGGAVIGLADHTTLALGPALVIVFGASAVVALIGAAIAPRVRADPATIASP
jgi:MFS family permease